MGLKKMNAFDWAVEHHHTRLCRILVGLILPVMRYSPLTAARLSNALMCERFVQGLPRVGGRQAPYRLMAYPDWARELVDQLALKQVLLGGNLNEQAEFTAGFQPPFLTRLSASTNTPEQVEKALDYLGKQSEEAFILLAHESILTRAYLTFVKQTLSRHRVYRIYPYALLEPNRAKMSLPFLEIASCYEAIRLGRYQRKGDVATLEEAFAYLQATGQNSSSEPAKTMVVIF